MPKPFTITVPAELGDKALVPFFHGWKWIENPDKDEVVIDLSKCEFLAPWALTFFSLYSLWLGEEMGHDVRIALDPNTRAGRYAVQAGLFELLQHERPKGIGNTNEFLTVPLRQIQSSKDIPIFVAGVAKLLDLNNEELEGAVRYSFVELLRNVVQHSRSPVGGLGMAQYFPGTGLVQVVVADAGVGVLTTLRPRYPELINHLAALKVALLPHVSGTFGMGAYGSMKDNAGLGLFFIREIATRASGGFFLGSGDGLVDLWGNADGSPGRKYVISRRDGWRGTFAVLQLRRDNIEDFDSLLSVCRSLAAQARRDDAQVALDFIDDFSDMKDFVRIDVSVFEEDVDQAAKIREVEVIPALKAGNAVVLNFDGIRFATQSFVHALMYRVIRDVPEARAYLSLGKATDATKEAIRAVAAYARTAREQTT